MKPKKTARPKRVTEKCRLCPRPPERHWRASWIWFPEPRDWRNAYVLFRHTFAAEGALTIRIAAETCYDLFFDGRRVARGTAVSVPAYKTFDTHTFQTPSGKHTLAVCVHHLGQASACSFACAPGLLVELTLPGGRRLGSDTTWRTLHLEGFTNPSIPVELFGYPHAFDWRRFPAGWATPQFDDSAWKRAAIVARPGEVPWKHLIPRDIPLLRTRLIGPPAIDRVGCWTAPRWQPIPNSQATLPLFEQIRIRNRVTRRVPSSQRTAWPLELRAERSGAFAVLDFGREVSGHLRLVIHARHAGVTMDVAYDEALDRSRGVDPARLRMADRHVLQQGRHVVEAFNARGFRYIMLDFPPGSGAVTIAGVELDERTYPVELRGSFRCSDPALERLYAAGYETARLCMFDAFVDCPGRERLPWLDTYYTALFASYATGDTALWRRTLYLFTQNACRGQKYAGAALGYFPAACEPEQVYLGFLPYYIWSVADYVAHSGDLNSGRNFFPMVLDQFRILGQYERSDGLIGDQWKHYQFFDFSAMDHSGVSACMNAMYLMALTKGATLAEWLGAKARAATWKAKSARLRKVYCKTFWQARRQCFADALAEGRPGAVCSLLTNLMALAAGIGGAARLRVLRRLLNARNLGPVTPRSALRNPAFEFPKNKIVPFGTPSFGHLLGGVLFGGGQGALALAYIKAQWLPLTVNGTFCEYFKKDSWMSYCHGFGASGATVLPRNVLGVRPVSPGWRTISFCPDLAGLDWAAGRVPTPLGEIEVALQRRSRRLLAEIKAPAGMRVVRMDQAGCARSIKEGGI